MLKGTMDGGPGAVGVMVCLCPLHQVGSGMETLLLMVDESPLAVEWRTPEGRNRPSHIWVSQGWWVESGLGQGWGGIVRKVVQPGLSLNPVLPAL